MTMLRKIQRVACAVSFVLLWGSPVHAAPPDGMTLDPALSQWFRSLNVPAGPQKGWGCCSMADCRTAAYRAVGSRYEVFIKRGTRSDMDAFADGDDQWHAVAEDHILRRHDNPTGEAVACYWEKEVLCLVLPSLT